MEVDFYDCNEHWDHSEENGGAAAPHPHPHPHTTPPSNRATTCSPRHSSLERHTAAAAAAAFPATPLPSLSRSSVPAPPLPSPLSPSTTPAAVYATEPPSL